MATISHFRASPLEVQLSNLRVRLAYSFALPTYHVVLCNPEHWIVPCPDLEALLEIIVFDAVRNQTFVVEALSACITHPKADYPEELIAEMNEP